MINNYDAFYFVKFLYCITSSHKFCQNTNKNVLFSVSNSIQAKNRLYTKFPRIMYRLSTETIPIIQRIYAGYIQIIYRFHAGQIRNICRLNFDKFSSR